jgi:hypothetical protein
MTAVKLDFEATMERSGELGRYQVAGAERVLLLHRGAKGMEMLDVPASGVGDCFWVDHVVKGGADLHALVVEYVRHAHRLGCSPMSRQALDTIVGLSEDGLASALADSIAGAS